MNSNPLFTPSILLVGRDVASHGLSYGTIGLHVGFIRKTYMEGRWGSPIVSLTKATSPRADQAEGRRDRLRSLRVD
jgi:hypothetical protein